MNTPTYLNFNLTSLGSNVKYLLFAALALSLALFSVKPVVAGTTVDKELLQNKVDNILINTEKAIASLRIDADISLKNIEDAMGSIEKLESAYSTKVHTETRSKHNTEIAKSYKHYYPPLGETLENNSALPNLSYKINSNVLYKGNDNKGELTNAYLDYTFAKASLMTAKDAINDGDKLEAMANLKRVFEAVYLAPDFKVAG